jgi:hypothetical protein
MKTILEKLKAIPGASWALSMKNEILIGIIVLIGFAHLSGWLRKIDPTSAGLDLGVLTIPAIGVVGVVAGVFLFWVLWRFCFPKDIDEWFDRPFDDDNQGFLADFFSASPAVRLACFFGSLWAVLISVGLITMALR